MLLKKILYTPIFLLAIAGTSSTASAQTTAKNTINNEDSAKESTTKIRTRVIEEVVVTARKEEESIQDVPVAVTALSEQSLKNTSTFSTVDLQYQVPNITTREQGGQSTAAVFQIRGQVQNEVIASLDTSVAFYDDGVYIARPHGVNIAFVDIASVQVLRGPQGTLFGHNTTGGAIVVNSNAPDLGELSGSISAVAASFGSEQYTGVLNIPLIDNTLGLRIAGQTLSTDGYSKDLTNGYQHATKEHDFLRMRLLWEPTDTLAFDLSSQYIKIDQRQNAIIPLFALNPSDTSFIESLLTGNGGVEACCLTFALAPDYNDYVRGNSYDTNYDPGFLPETGIAIQSLTLSTDWELPWFTAKFISSFRSYDDLINRLDIDGTPNKIVDTKQTGDGEQLSFELQFTGISYNDRLQWAAGIYHFDESVLDLGETDAFLAVHVVTRGYIDNISQGIYAQATYRMWENVGITAGLRYSTDEKGLRITAETADTCSIPDEYQDPNENCVGVFNKDFSKVNYTLGIDYAFNDDAMIYGSLTTGYRAGGQNLRGTTPETLSPFDPENVTQLELGMKSDWFDQLLRANLAVFWADYTDIQRTQFIAVNGVPATVTSNAASASISGLELELTALPTDRLELGASLGLLSAEYDEFNGFDGTDKSDEKFDDVPEMTYSVSATYTIEFGADYMWMNRLDYSWADDIPSQQGNLKYFKDRGYDAEPITTFPATGNLNARSNLSFASGLDISIYGRNLTDEYRYTSIILGQGPDFISRIVSAPGRNYGVEVSYNF
jgi:iron complex outermembrane receptor protein|tara:strand:- start:70538 stop:72871 length:2334 start_codon:yes stop_codon:yes gene_type:complete